MALNIDQTGNIVMASAFSIDPADVFGSSGSKNASTNLTTSGGNVTAATITTTKYAGIININASSGNPISCSAGGAFTLTINNTNVAAQDCVLANVAWVNGQGSGGQPTIGTIAPSAGAVVITIVNAGTTAFTGNLQVSYIIFKN